MDLGLKERVALVAGASTGIGYGAALALSREGARVVIGSRSRGGTKLGFDGISASGTPSATWPKLPMIESTTRIGRRLDRILHEFEPMSEPEMDAMAVRLDPFFKGTNLAWKQPTYFDGVGGWC